MTSSLGAVKGYFTLPTKENFNSVFFLFFFSLSFFLTCTEKIIMNGSYFFPTSEVKAAFTRAEFT